MARRFPAKRRRRKLGVAFLLLILLGAAFTGWMYRTATAAPVVRRAEVALTGLTEPLRAVLLSDIHVGGPDMPPERLARIVAQVNALRPDLVLIAGDLVSDKRVSTRRYELAEAIAPLAALSPRIGTYAVLGNHDHWRDANEARLHLRRARITVLDNDAVQAGPLAVGGLDDAYTKRHDLARTVQRLRRLSGARILISHSPDPFPDVPADMPLMAAGHTHCGQIRLPLVGAISTMSEHGNRYACGRIDEAGRTLIVSAGLGTSILPLRLGAVPDLWLIELRPSHILPIEDGAGV
jgi:predicted MPP superfamily phosphohydrolase